MEVRVGNGFDVHKFTDGNILRLCGININFHKKLAGHSDADVALHALTDALFGAIAEGDIGTWFPPTESKWKNADSSIFLKCANEEVGKKGFKISNIDLTIICEEPKINCYSDDMKQFLSSTLNLSFDRINVKATTTEQLGFTGRKEGIAALCTVMLVEK
ncbi:MAG: 2-C-methyl-D-erythritol 2,4-cyclodiphosphate synthase [Paracoccaceae bacterium]